MLPHYPEHAYLGLVSEPVEDVLCWVAVSPGGEQSVIVSLQALPLYCPGPFFMVEALGQSGRIARRFRDVHLPEVDVSSTSLARSAEAVAVAIDAELLPFRARLDTPAKLASLLRWAAADEQLEAEEARAFSLLRLGEYGEARNAFRGLSTPPGHLREEDSSLSLGVQDRARCALGAIDAGPDAVIAVMEQSRSKKMNQFGIAGQ